MTQPLHRCTAAPLPTLTSQHAAHIERSDRAVPNIRMATLSSPAMAASTDAGAPTHVI
ncbi:hypothetical protein LPH55_08110 [Xylella taiwanensis]|uniref:Uncharacterized protein n=1 Tax=Xylella taiwanensis TaxID=1444770 RepID=A0ABS8TX07_9GAMM|nr:hypothetical protein [Xylella taiwanensis]MCD8473418.1 hypothetical protein [Xylella taiwanensis]